MLLIFPTGTNTRKRLDEQAKTTTYLWENLSNPDKADDFFAFNTAFNTKKSVWEWYEQPENAFRLKRFNIGMKMSTAMFAGGSAILKGVSQGFLRTCSGI